MRASSTTAAIAAVAVALATGGDTLAQPRCFFLECAPGDSTTPIATKPLEPPPSPPAASPRPKAPTPVAPTARSIERPTSNSETCRDVTGGHTYCVSSVLAPQHGFTYGPENLTDGKLDTAWVEGKPGDGIGEWIVATVNRSKRLRGFELLNGYHKNAELFRRNGRVKTLEVVLSNGYRQTVMLADGAGPQRFTLDEAVAIEWVQLVIRSVYAGTKYKDTALTELHLLTD